MRPVQAWARKHRIQFFLPYFRPSDRVLEIGPGEGWFQKAIREALPVDYVTIDTHAPADIQGNIRDWRKHALELGSFDVIVAIEVVEHTDCFEECRELLKPGGLMLVTTPMPQFDRILKLLEIVRLTQKRTSPHNNLTYLKRVPGFTIKKARYPFRLGQWVVLRKTV